MTNQISARRQELIDAILNQIKTRVPPKQRDLLADFAKYYYASSSLADLYEHTVEDLAGAFWSHWDFIYQRTPGESKVRVFNPTLEQDGWQSTHTIIEVSHDDIPFLVDSIRMELNREALEIHFIIHFGGLKLKRDKNHQVIGVVPVGSIDATAQTEAPIYIEIDRLADPAQMETLGNNIQRVLADVRVAVADWPKMLAKVEEVCLDLEHNPPPLDPAEIAESRDFLRWMMSNNFTFLGCRDYKLVGKDVNKALLLVPKTGLGVLRDESNSKVSRRYAELPPLARKLALSEHILIIAKTNTKSSVHRSDYTDYIGVKRFNSAGELIGERRFIGLYTSSAYHTSPLYIPFLRHKVTKILDELGFPSASHNGKEALHILETLPRDDLFQATHEELVKLTMGILHLQERKRIRLFIRKDSYSRYFSCLVYVPREIFNTELSSSMQDILLNELKGLESSFATYFSDSALARIHFLIRVNPRTVIEYDEESIEQKLIHIARSWGDELKTHLTAQFGEAEGLKFYAKYARAFPSSYTEFYRPQTAINDIIKMEALSAANPLGMLFYKPASQAAGALRFKLFHTEHPIALSDVLPTLENMGLRVMGERPHEIILKNGKTIWINDFDMVHVKSKIIDATAVRDIFQDAFANIWARVAEDDGFNRLVLEAHLTWREAAVLRAYTKYLRQTGFTFSQEYVAETLVTHAEIAKNLAELFKLRFSPDQADENSPDTSVVVTKIEQFLDAVTSLDEDRILRRMLEAILATIRTNYFQKSADGKEKSYMSFKFDPSAMTDLPLPHPKYEIFVYSPSVEGVHLRGGKVARGGLRWSDRREDFRTEVLGLMKAQQVKNSVIVPMGAKGGFFPKLLPINGDRDAIMREVVACYSTFIRGLLDVTDNIVEGKVIPPENVVRYDEDDTYLVVAADKGTATFSDIANGIAKEYNFWLGDAFASGGSAGYDHKKMGITARGAWESVKRHFREINIDPEKDDFTVIGIGDMAGDVFGNGMLLSKHIKLLAAFNHMHIFIDPKPNAANSFKERKRLFDLPRSSWLDYDAKLISKGGGVFNRAAKSIKITPEMKQAFNLDQDFLTPNELIQALLRAPVDLIWNGGIGTFVKATHENHLDVGDKTNDAIRVDAAELRVKVIGEGGNLGMTQLARVEYSLNGGNVYTDFIDNSAGVDCSDHEVNIKILLNSLVARGEMTLSQRNRLLEKMTDEVAELVIFDNYQQTQMLSLEASVATQTLDLFRRYINELEKSGRLKRRLEFLPDDKSLLERKAHNKALTRPELAILIAYCKTYLKQDILASDLPEEPYFTKYLMMAFPQPLSKKYLPEMKQHRLRREIIATQLAKNVTDRMGINYIDRIQRETGASAAFVVRAFAVASEVYKLDELWAQIEALDYLVPIAIQQKMMLQIYYLIRRATRWFVRNRPADMDIDSNIQQFARPVSDLIKQLPGLLPAADAEQLESEIVSLTETGVPEELARSIASCNTLFTSLDIVEASAKYGFKVAEVAKMYYGLGSHLELNWLREQMSAYSVENIWDELARSTLRDDIDRIQKKISVHVLQSKAKHKRNMKESIEYWLEHNKSIMSRWQGLLSDIKFSNNVSYVTFSVVLRELFDFAQSL